MTIYVDDMMPHRSGLWCHMMTDGDLEELHAMAERIGLQRRWFQKKDPRFPHYDLRESRRNLAIRYGAKAVSGEDMLLACVPSVRERLDKIAQRKQATE